MSASQFKCGQITNKCELWEVSSWGCTSCHQQENMGLWVSKREFAVQFQPLGDPCRWMYPLLLPVISVLNSCLRSRGRGVCVCVCMDMYVLYLEELYAHGDIIPTFWQFYFLSYHKFRNYMIHPLFLLFICELSPKSSIIHCYTSVEVAWVLHYMSEDYFFGI